MVRYALQRGHTVTIFNRGRSNTHLFPEVERLIGDRENDLETLRGRAWDVVIDNSASVPWWVRDSAQLLKDSVDRYLFTSTRSTYSDFSQVGMNEDGPQHDPDPSGVDERRSQGYGPNKVLCEREARRAFGDRSLIVRPGLIVGPGDNTDRFSYWPIRVDRGGEMLCPGDPENPVMFIDVRDLAEWYIHMLENGTVGTYNALGPEAPLSFAEMIYGCRAVTSAEVSFTWVDTDFLLEREMRPYSDFPCWMPARGARAGFQRFDLTRPLAAGLKYRPLAVTARDTLNWHKTRPAERQARLRSGITAEKEAELLAEWHAQDR
jgi:2'-hydroxyisoflavone reductase